MKRRKWICLILILACLGMFLAYRIVTKANTDTCPPVITFSEETLELSVEDPQSALLQGVTAKDAIDGDVTDLLVVEKVRILDGNGKIQVTYAAFDRSGNVTKAERTGRYTDYVSPRFHLSRALVFSTNASFDLFRIVSAEDGLDGDLSARLRITLLDETSVSAQGTHRVQLRVTNSLEDTAVLEVPVEVYAAGTYTADLTLSDYLIYLPVGSSFQPQDYLSGITFDKKTVSLQNGCPDGYDLEMNNTVNTAQPGVYTVHYKVTAAGGYYVGYSMLIVVVEG